MTTNNSANTRVMGRRILALLIDQIIVGILLFMLFSAFGDGGETIAEDGEVVYQFRLTDSQGALFWGLFLLYYTVTEAWKGATFGKLVCGLRVKTESGEPVTFSQALIRNLLRVVDGLPYFLPYLLGLIVAANSDKRQRLRSPRPHHCPCEIASATPFSSCGFNVVTHAVPGAQSLRLQY